MWNLFKRKINRILLVVRVRRIRGNPTTSSADPKCGDVTRMVLHWGFSMTSLRWRLMVDLHFGGDAKWTKEHSNMIIGVLLLNAWWGLLELIQDILRWTNYVFPPAFLVYNGGTSDVWDVECLNKGVGDLVRRSVVTNAHVGKYNLVQCVPFIPSVKLRVVVPCWNVNKTTYLRDVKLNETFCCRNRFWFDQNKNRKRLWR